MAATRPLVGCPTGRVVIIRGELEYRTKQLSGVCEYS